MDFYVCESTKPLLKKLNYFFLNLYFVRFLVKKVIQIFFIPYLLEKQN